MMRMCKPGMREYQLEAVQRVRLFFPTALPVSLLALSRLVSNEPVAPAFLPWQFWSEFYGGARIESYTWIVGSGPNAAILHYGHSGAPNDRVIQEGDIVLGDLGNEVRTGKYSIDLVCGFL